MNAGYPRIAVISGIGVRDYYRRKGYCLDNTSSNHGGFMIKNLVHTGSLQHDKTLCIATGQHYKQPLHNNNNNNTKKNNNNESDNSINESSSIKTNTR